MIDEGLRSEVEIAAIGLGLTREGVLEVLFRLAPFEVHYSILLTSESACAALARTPLQGCDGFRLSLLDLV